MRERLRSKVVLPATRPTSRTLQNMKGKPGNGRDLMEKANKNDRRRGFARNSRARTGRGSYERLLAQVSQALHIVLERTPR